MNFEFVPEFEKDLKRLGKKWRSLPEDVEYVKPRIESLYIKRDDVDPAQFQQYRADFFAGKTATRLPSETERVEVVKMRLDVAALATNSKVRIVFIAIVSENTIRFVEMYAKNEKDREDKARIKKYSES